MNCPNSRDKDGIDTREASEAEALPSSLGTKSPNSEKIGKSEHPKQSGLLDVTLDRVDEGWFGPGSVAWKVWLHPTFTLHGFARAVTIQHLDPDLVAAVDDSGQVYKRTPTRYDRTMEYFIAWIAADSRTVIKMSDILMKVHDRSFGTNKVTNNTYDANSPESQLWIHIVAWQSILNVYEILGPGRLSRDEENEYWQQCAIAAKAQPIRQNDIPRTRGEVKKYLDDWREKLSASEAAIRNVDHILDGAITVNPQIPSRIQKLMRPIFRSGVIATYPRWMRPMLGVKQSRTVDALAICFWRPLLAVVAANPRIYLWMIARLCPRAYRYYKPALLGVPAKNARTVSPEYSRQLYGNPLSPLEQREQLLSRRQEGTGNSAYAHNHTDAIVEFRAADAG